MSPHFIIRNTACAHDITLSNWILLALTDQDGANGRWLVLIRAAALFPQTSAVCNYSLACQPYSSFHYQ